MELETFAWLLGDEGQTLLQEAMRADLGDAAKLQTLTRLRQKVTPERAAALYETAVLRQRAKAKFNRADGMYFTREALEQASGELISRYRAARYRGYEHVADLCCSIGGDMLGLAQHARVSGVDFDKLRLAMAEANANVYGLRDHVSFVQANLEQQLPPHADALFFDPARRSSGKRAFSFDAYTPSMRLVPHWLERTSALGIKVSPGVSDEDLNMLGQGEVEFISVDGELKEAVLWFGPLATQARRATLLSHANAEHAITLAAETTRVGEHLAEPGSYLYEPDPAIIRAHLVTDVAERIGAAQLDPSIAYVTANSYMPTPFARCWHVLEWLPFNQKRLRARLQALDAGEVTVKKRGSPIDTDMLARQLRGTGSRSLVVVLTRLFGKPIALICEGPI